MVCSLIPPKVNVEEIAFQGAKTFLANGFINGCGRVVGEGKERMNTGLYFCSEPGFTSLLTWI